MYWALVTPGMVGSNYTQDLKDRGLATPGAFKKLWDYNLGVGGPIVKDRLWFFAQGRHEGYQNTVPGMFANANANDPTKWTYVPDRSRPAYQAASFGILALRLTAQVSPTEQGERVVGRAEALRRRRPHPRLRGMPALGTRSDHLRGSVADPGVLGDRRSGDRRLPERRAAGAAAPVDVTA